MKYKTCVSIGEKNPKKLKTILKKALTKSDYVEIRFDYLKKSDIPVVLEDVKKALFRCVCTLRPKSEGGLFLGKEEIQKLIKQNTYQGVTATLWFTKWRKINA